MRNLVPFRTLGQNDLVEVYGTAGSTWQSIHDHLLRWMPLRIRELAGGSRPIIVPIVGNTIALIYLLGLSLPTTIAVINIIEGSK